MAVKKIDFYKEPYLAVITWNKKHLKQVAPIPYKLEKTFFAVANFESL